MAVAVVTHRAVLALVHRWSVRTNSSTQALRRRKDGPGGAPPRTRRCADFSRSHTGGSRRTSAKVGSKANSGH